MSSEEIGNRICEECGFEGAEKWFVRIEEPDGTAYDLCHACLDSVGDAFDAVQEFRNQEILEERMRQIA